MILLLLLLFNACSCCREWKFSRSTSVCPSFTATRLLLPPSDEYRGLQFHVDSGEFGTRAVVSSLHRRFPCYQGNPQAALFKVEIEGETQYFEVERLKGGQQLLLSNKATELILNHLETGHCVSIAVGSHKDVLEISNLPRMPAPWPYTGGV